MSNTRPGLYDTGKPRVGNQLVTEIESADAICVVMASTRLHAKGWLFERHSGFSTAYIGSSIWKLHHPLPGDLFAQFAAAVA